MAAGDRRVIGVDESGKGDFFGPLVVAALAAPDSALADLKGLGVRDGKGIADRRLLTIDEQLRRAYPFAVEIMPPEEYNRAYEKIRNLNRLLADLHARAIDRLLRDHPADLVVVDQFGKTALVAEAVAFHGHSVALEQRFRAEEIPQVAAASIIARAEFIRQLQTLSREMGVELPKGAAAIVDRAGAALVRQHGRDILRKTAKIHFKNYQRVINPSLFPS
ncbi:MAG TPA: ribonuclease HIII [candidate division Zixibacteria bacterium]|nr:ribonuclease HIII [candidate division Zixibacteria bacterium]MDD4917220.1 ribonuclease HIII [candidate division Zixibacteria bacterium]MDM7971686.1 ribonuclease HIII [candidate division Zixibacteria bacterium]HOD65882.1 ribonuclease HIII [candidate division Zixibacteria bacterium]HPI32457.1 ribonuclease HIII [candidate division Zixibacteria bacterium]